MRSRGYSAHNLRFRGGGGGAFSLLLLLLLHRRWCTRGRFPSSVRRLPAPAESGGPFSLSLSRSRLIISERIAQRARGARGVARAAGVQRIRARAGARRLAPPRYRERTMRLGLGEAARDGRQVAVA